VKQRNLLKSAILGLAVLAFAALAPSASAAVVGHLTFVNCLGTPGNPGGVTVTIGSVTWLPPVVVGTDGCIGTGLNTNVTYDTGSGTGTITPAELGTVNNLSPGNGNIGFIAFPGVTFTASGPAPWNGIGPGVANTTCATGSSGAACSVVAGSPFVLTPESYGTLISLSVSGFATDASSSNSLWTGIFSTQLDGQSPSQIQTLFNSQGSFTATYSFDGNVGVPEPISLALMGGGLLALAVLKRRQARS
jgi:hypothetical protein